MKIAKAFLKNSINSFLSGTFLLALCFVFSCATSKNKDATPSWYASPKQNNSENLYGVAQGFTLEEATKYALADAASRLMVSISSESNLLREENNVSVNEEMRQQVRQNVEKISFTNFKVTRSEKIGSSFYVEAQIERAPFLKEQKENVYFIEKQISDLEKDLAKNPIQKRNSLVKILSLGKDLELKSRILTGAGEDINLKEKLSRIAYFQNQLDKTSNKIEFYFEINSPKEIAQTIRNSLNKEKIKIAPSRNSSDANQIVIKIKSESRSNKIYESYMTKLEVDFENIAEGKIIASNSIEVVGSSTIGEKESYMASLKSLEEKISQDGILKIIGITN
jgi:hypothetical protein